MTITTIPEVPTIPTPRVQYHFCREHMAKKHVNMAWCSTDNNVADGLTKPLKPVKFAQFVEQCRLTVLTLKGDDLE
jgi:hypothetical protein